MIERKKIFQFVISWS